ncbi:MAG: imelysin family protein [Dokdonia sp.]|jgi:predicted lipoprotein|nr:peptidase M75 [Cytophagaceae bacterium]
MKKLIALLSFCLFLIACSDSDDPAVNGDNGPSEVSFDREAMLAHWADAIIIPGYEDFATKVAALNTAATNFTTATDASNLLALQTAWDNAYLTWQRVSMFEIGPAETVNLRLNVNIYPANTTIIENNIANGDYNLDLSSNRAAKGFAGLDYILFGLENSPTAIVGVYNGPNGAAYKQYLLDIINDMKFRTDEVLSNWNTTYRATFVSNSGASATASTDRLVNDVIFYYEKHLRAGKMGIPGGVFSGTPAPNTIEALYAGDRSKMYFLEGLQAVQDFFNGVSYDGSTQDESLSAYLDALNAVKEGADLNTIINTQFDTARAAVTGLDSFANELENNPPIAFLDAYEEVQRIVPLLKVDMVSAMSISIDFADADGD